jgi:hypothetical protein
LRRFRGTRGQIVPLYAIALPVLLGFLALSLDGGKLYVTRIHLQNAADAATLAASLDLGPCADGSCAGLPAEDDLRTNSVEPDVNSYSSKNGGPAVLAKCIDAWWKTNHKTDPARDSTNVTACYLWPYLKKNDGSDSNCLPWAADPTSCARWDQVEVRIRKPVNLSFAGVVGFHNPAYPFARSVGTFSRDTVFHPGDPGSPGGEVTNATTWTDPGQTHTTETVIDGTTYTTTTVIPGATHTTTNVTAGSCPAGSADCGVAFAKSTECPAITYNGAGGDKIGSLMTNGGFKALGNAGKIVGALYLGKYSGSEDACYINGGRATVKSGPFGPFSPQDWPLALPTPPTPVPLSRPTLVGNQCWDITSGGSGAATKPGVYCSTVPITLSKTFDGYTWFAPCISISGNTHTFHYYRSIDPAQGARQQTLFYASGDDATCAALGAKPVSVQGQTNTINGDIFAPFGQINMQGGGVAGGDGFLESQTLFVAGNFASYRGTGPLEGASITTVTTTDPNTTVFDTTVTGGSTNTNFTTDPDTTNSSTTVITILPIPSTPDSTETTGTGSGLGE